MLRRNLLLIAALFSIRTTCYSADEIKIGNLGPYSGPAAEYSTCLKTMGAYFSQANDEHVLTKTIKFISLDDGYSPPKSLEQARILVEKDDVNLLAGNAGGAPNGATISYFEEHKIPDLFLMTGVSAFNSPEKHRFAMTLLPSYFSEGKAIGSYVLKNVKEPKIAILYQNDAFGKDFLNGFKEALGKENLKLIVGEESFQVSDPTQDSQVLKLKSTGANVFYNISAGKATPQIIRKINGLNWKPLQFVTSPSISINTVLKPAGLENSKGIMAFVMYKLPNDPRWQNDADVKKHLAILKKYAPDVDPNDALTSIGAVIAGATIRVLKDAGGDLSKDNILKKALELKSLTLPMMMPGISISLSPTDYSAFKQVQPIEFDGQKWVSHGDLVTL